MALVSQNIEVPLIGMNQSWPVTAGPAGRIRTMINGVASKYMVTQSGTILRVGKRFGFFALPTTVLDPSSGASSPHTLSNPVMLTTFGKQLVAVAGAAAFVLSESAGCWESPVYTCPGDMLREKSIYNGGTVSSTPDSARIGTRTMYSWTDVVPGGAGNLTMAMIVDDDGTVIRTPFSVDSVQRVKVATDGVVFFLLWVSAGGIQIHAFDTNGNDVANNAVAFVGPYFDVTKRSNDQSIWITQKTNAANTFNLYRVTFSGGVVSIASTFTVAGTAASTGRVAFIRNDADTNLYVGAIDGAGPFDHRVYQVDNAGTVQHTYAVSLASAAEAMEIAGFVQPTGNKDITVALSFLDATPTPQKNFTEIRTVTFAGVTTLQKTRSSLTVVSRPFVLKDGSYYVVGYYQTDSAGINALQSTFFLISLSNPWQVCGRWDWGTAYADWQVTASNFLYMHIATPTVDPLGGIHVPLTYRARSFITKAQPGGTTGTDVPPIANREVSSIGIENVSFGPETGQPFEAFGELLLPGPRATTYTGNVFADHGLPLYPEIMSIAPAGGGSLSASTAYEYVAVAEANDSNGNRVRSMASAPFPGATGVAQTQNTVVGVPIHTTSRAGVSVSLYRNYKVNGILSTDHRKVTSDLAPVLNSDGSATWTFVDQVSDAAAAVGEILYVDKDLLDQFPCPPFKAGCPGFNRAAVIGHDGAVWFSGLKTEGDALWFNPALRVTMPNQDEAITIAALDNAWVIFCKGSSIYTIPGNAIPDNTGAGTFATPQPLPFSNGCTGFALTTSDGIFYSSTQGGVWSVSRDAKNAFVGQGVLDDVAASSVVGIANDANQRTGVLLANGDIQVWDSIADVWGKWQVTTTGTPRLIAAHKGAFAVITSSGNAYRQTPGVYDDGAPFGPPIITTVEVVCHLGDVRGFKRVWNQQYWAEVVGAHLMTVTESFDDDFGTTQFTYGPFTPPGRVVELPPKVEECSSVTLKFVDSFSGDGSAGYALEMLAFEVGREQGLGRLAPSTFRIKAT